MTSTFTGIKKLQLILFILISFTVFPSMAARVSAVKGKKVLISGSDVKLNKLYYVTQNGKKRGILKIVKTQGNRAIGLIIKGSATSGNALVLRKVQYKGGRTAKRSSRTNYNDYSYNPKSSVKYSKEFGIGGTLGLVQTGADVKFVSSNASLSGSAISFKAFGDYGLTKNIYLRGYFGTQPFEASESGNGCDGADCVMSINYLSADVWGRYVFNPTSNLRFWGGAGLGLLFPLGTGNTNAVNKSEIGSTMLFQFGGGIDWFINDKFYIPLSLEYNLIPPSDTVSTSMISARAGLGMKL